MITANLFEITFPVAALKGKIEKPEVIGVFGTCFSVGPEVFLTAGHVITNATEAGRVAVGCAQSGGWKFSEVDQSEVFEDMDLAVFRADGVSACILTPVAYTPPLGVPVFTVGYPFAYDPDLNVIDPRVFYGNLVASTFDAKRFPSLPRLYEVSFMCPRGLSGAPLFQKENLNVLGVVLGNRSIEMTVLSSREREESGNETTIYEKVEALNIGIALASKNFSRVDSSIYGGQLLNMEPAGGQQDAAHGRGPAGATPRQ